MQDSNSPVMEELIFLHDLITTILFLSGIIFIWFVILSTLFSSLINRFLSEKHICKSFWVIVPVIILIQICIPSLLLFYALDESVNSNLTIKAIGHQWYWSYEYRDFWATRRGLQNKFDISITLNSGLEKNIFQLLNINNTSELKLVIISSRDNSLNKSIPVLIINTGEIGASSRKQYRIFRWEERFGRSFFSEWKKIVIFYDHKEERFFIKEPLTQEQINTVFPYRNYQNIWNEKFSTSSEEEKIILKQELYTVLKNNASYINKFWFEGPDRYPEITDIFHTVDDSTKNAIYNIKTEARFSPEFNDINSFSRTFVKWLISPQGDCTLTKLLKSSQKD